MTSQRKILFISDASATYTGWERHFCWWTIDPPRVSFAQ